MNRQGLALISVLVTFPLVLSACSTDVTESAEYLELRREFDALTVDYEALSATSAIGADRRAGAERVMGELVGILDDPGAVGDADAVADLIATHAADDAVMDDVVFGAYPYREAFFNTLYFGGADATIEVYHSWISQDGASGGFLWMWSGTNPSGHAFELAGISLVDFAEDGRIAYELVTYPYPSEYVREAWMGEGTPVASTG